MIKNVLTPFFNTFIEKFWQFLRIIKLVNLLVFTAIFFIRIFLINISYQSKPSIWQVCMTYITSLGKHHLILFTMNDCSVVEDIFLYTNIELFSFRTIGHSFDDPSRTIPSFSEICFKAYNNDPYKVIIFLVDMHILFT